MADRKPIDLSFPVKGYDENWAYKAQPAGTSPSALNVRPYDTISQRLRGGQRPGSSKYIATQPNGANPIQLLHQEPKAASGFLEAFPYANGTDFDSIGNPWRHYAFSSSSWIGTASGGTAPATWVSATAYKLGDQVVHTGTKYVCKTANSDAVFTAGNWTAYTPLSGPGLIQGNAYRVTATTPASWTAHVAQQSAPTGDMTVSMTITHVGASDDSCLIGLLVRTSETTGYYIEYMAATTSSCGLINVYDNTGSFVPSGSAGFLIMGYTQPWAPGGAAPGQVTQNTPVRMTVTVEGSIMRIYLNGVLVSTIAGIGNTGNKAAGFAAVAGGEFEITDFALSGAAVNIGSSGRILGASAGNLYSGAASDVWSLVGTDFIPSGIIRAQSAFGKVYLVDGVAAHYRVYDPTTRTTITWTPTAGSLPVGVSDPSLGATIIALYRGRVVLSGIEDDSQNWFMSKAGDPLDWDYGATPSAIMAVAGNNSVAGLVGDRITCLAPANDDLMVMGGDHTLWIMRGDPADGGRIDNISNQIGVVGPDAFSFDPGSNLYFFGNGVLWRLNPQGEVTPLSRGRLDRTFGAIDFSTHTMRLLWDNIYHGLHIFITPLVSGTSTHYWWDARTDSFWPDQYPNAHGPTVVLQFDADALADRAILLGGQDGYIRTIDASAKTDDGTTILSRVKLGPMTPGHVHQNARISRVTTLLESTSNPVMVRLYAAQSPETVVAASPVWSYVVTSVNQYSIPRIGGNSILIELINDSFSASWVTGTVYAVGDQVVATDGNPYLCIVAHTSTTGGTHPTPPGNTTDWSLSVFRTWAMESVSVIMDVGGRTRHGRL